MLAAYGWSDLHLPLDTDTLLQRLVELNAQRGAEEAQGRIRLLRPAFQNPQAATELPAWVQQVLDVDTDPSAAAALAATTKPAQQPWPATLPEQVPVMLAASPAPSRKRTSRPTSKAVARGKGPAHAAKNPRSLGPRPSHYHQGHHRWALGNIQRIPNVNYQARNQPRGYTSVG